MNASLTLEQATKKCWDVVVIGAGPAGAMAALYCARAGLATLLLDAHRFPRDKVCGGCLNSRVLLALQRADLSHLLKGAATTRQLRLYRSMHPAEVACVQEAAASNMAPGASTFRRGAGGRSALLAPVLQLPLPRGVVIERAAFDAKLTESVQQAGGVFLDETTATVLPSCDANRLLEVASHGKTHRLAARVVVCADGLHRNSIRRLTEFSVAKTHRSRIGLGATLLHDDQLESGAVHMIVGKSGYIGLVDVGNGRARIAAAVDPQSLSGQQTADDWITSVLSGVGLNLPQGSGATHWRGTPPLTSRTNRVATTRLFLVGDAAGYVEPFTGEGMASAFESGQAVAPLVEQACAGWQPQLADEWERVHRRLIGKRQHVCRLLAWTLRRNWAVTAALRAAGFWSWPARRVIAGINQSRTAAQKNSRRASRPSPVR